MHAKTSKEIIHATRYLQVKPTIIVDPDIILCFPSFSKNSKYTSLLQECSKKTLSVQEYERESRKWEL